MSRLYDTVEPTVIDEDVLRRAVQEQTAAERAEVTKKEGVDYRDVTCLRLDFKNILRIDNLWQFENLTKLQLDNNIIEKIENLDSLVNLEWLDLSFNNIQVIEGLDKLTKLTDLTLYNNRISRLENMDALVNLNVLSIGNNNLESLENLTYLRRFEALRCLNIAGNKFCQDPNHKAFAIAILPGLKYVDFRLIEDQARTAASEQYQEETLELEIKEREEKDRRKMEREHQALLLRHKDAYVEGLVGEDFFGEMLAEDPEYAKLSALPEAQPLFDEYRARFVVVCNETIEHALRQHDARTGEQEQFTRCITRAKEENRKEAAKNIEAFQSVRKKLLRDIRKSNDPKTTEMLVQTLRDHIRGLWTSLMGLEMELVDQLEDVVKEFERNMSDLTTSFVEQIQGHVVQLRELENNHHIKVSELANATMETFLKNEIEGDIPEELRQLFVDKDTLANILNASHDAHLGKIDGKEDEIVTRANRRLDEIVSRVHLDELTRNRNRVAEIGALIDHFGADTEHDDMDD